MTIGPYQGQTGDVRMFQTLDDGNIRAEGGILEMTGGFETAALLSLFGGNQDDDGSQNNPRGWWGNIGVTDTAERYVSRTQNLLAGLPAVSSNLRRVENAAKNDLQWLVESGAANDIDAVVTLVAPKRININISITADAGKINLNFLANWEAMQAAAAVPEPPTGVWSGSNWEAYSDGSGNAYVDEFGNIYVGVP